LDRSEKGRPDLAARKAQGILTVCMLRRKKDSEINGQKILNLKEKTVTMQGENLIDPTKEHCKCLLDIQNSNFRPKV